MLHRSGLCSDFPHSMLAQHESAGWPAAAAPVAGAAILASIDASGGRPLWSGLSRCRKHFQGPPPEPPGASADLRRASRRKRAQAPTSADKRRASKRKRRQVPAIPPPAEPPASRVLAPNRIYITVGSCLPPFSLVSSCATPNEERLGGRHQQEFKEEGTQEQQRVALAGACRRFAG